MLTLASALVGVLAAYFFVTDVPEFLMQGRRRTPGRVIGFLILNASVLLILAAALWEGDPE